MINPNYTSIVYQAGGVLMDLAEKIADSRSTKRIATYLDQAAKIRYYLNALVLTAYITNDQINNILQCIIDVAEIQDYPVTPNLPSVVVPSNGTTIVIEGAKGDKGDTGGATDFNVAGVTFTQVVDSFAVGQAYAARWDYIVNGTPQRAGSIVGTWIEDGSLIDWQDTSTPDVNGSTGGVEFTVEFSGGNIRLVANVTTGTWNILGSRYFIPNNGAGVTVSNTPLSNGNIFIGNASNIPVSNSVTGDVLITNVGVTSISAGVVVNADISPTAAISQSKIAALAASKAMVTDGSGFATTSTASTTEVGYLSGVTSGIQAQLDSKLSGATGAISTVTAVDLTASRAVISNPAGKIAVSGTTSTELSYVVGVTSAIQTQLNAKASTPTYVSIGNWDMSANDSVTVAHGIASGVANIKTIYAKIIRDDSAQAYNFIGTTLAGTGGGFITWDDTNVILIRTTGGRFQTTDFDSGAFNRGTLTITI